MHDNDENQSDRHARGGHGRGRGDAGGALKVTVGSIENGRMIPNKFAFCVAATEGYAKAGSDISPSISWSKGPAGTKSYAVVVHDT